MIIKTGRAGMVWVDWPPVEDGELWCRGHVEGGRDCAVYRLVDGAWVGGPWVEGEWEDTASEPGEREALH